MTKRPREDNVIYANFGARTRVSSPAETGAQTSEPSRVNRLSAPAMRIFNAAVRQTDVARAKRGRTYADGGHVLGLTAVTNGMHADVVGSQNEPFRTTLVLPHRSREDIETAIGSLVREAGSLERLRAGELNDDVLDILLCSSPDEVRFYCDCPDNAQVCKHAVALAQCAAELIDDDPSLILSMRGITLNALEDRKRRESHNMALENSAPGSPYFWDGHDLPDLPHPKIAPMIEDSDIHLLHRAMQSVSFTNIDQLRAVADIEDLYDDLTSS